MGDHPLDLHCTMLLEDYRGLLPTYSLLKQVIMQQLHALLQDTGIELTSFESRIKDETSLIGKLERKGSKYQVITDITDIVGARVIAYYNEDVDRIASIVEQSFDIDWANSVDKRKSHQFDSFGYNSLHYICRLPKELYYDSEHPHLNDIRFEVQMRTALQHVWSAIQHDIGYKSEIETPLEYHRNLSRLAGMLELADNEFSRIRNAVTDYRRRMQHLVKNGQLDEVPLDGDTFHSYLEGRPFDKLNHKIAAINQAELQSTTLIPFLRVLRQLGMKTLGDVERMIQENYDDAYQLALYQLGSTDIDILSDSVALQNLCIVHILKQGGGKPGLIELFNAVNGRNPQNATLATLVFQQASRLPFMNI